MRQSAELLALRKEVLVARASLYRVKLHRDLAHLREGAKLPALGVGLMGSAPVREIVLGLVLSRIGLGRVSRFIALAGGALGVARLVIAAIRKAPSPERPEPASAEPAATPSTPPAPEASPPA